MSKIANYLGNHLRGEVFTSSAMRQSVARDGSILRLTPLLVAYPYNTNDVRKIIHFAWQLAEKGHTLVLTPRGSGSNNTGAAIGSGLVVSLPAHFDKVLEIDTKQKLVRLQPGVAIRALQTAMHTHGLVWPVESHSASATVGGALSNNLYGETGGKYGPAGVWVDQLEVVLASGESIQTKRLSKRELNNKKGLSGMEGEIYRGLDGLLSDNEDLVADLARHSGSGGYALSRIRDKKGNFDLTPLFIGAQGSLGIITEAIIKLDHHHVQTEVIAALLDSPDELDHIIASVNKYNPSRVEFVDGATLNYGMQKLAIKVPELIAEDQDTTNCAGLLVIELNEGGRLKSKAKKVAKTLQKHGLNIVRSDGSAELAAEMKQSYDRLLLMLNRSETDDHKITVPIIEDALIPLGDAGSFLASAQALAKKHRLSLLLWAHLGSGVVHARPLLNLRNLTGKQKVSGFMNDYYDLVIKTDGSVAGESGEGRLRAAVAAKQFGKAETELFVSVKKIFDAHGIFNHGVKIAADKNPLEYLDETYSH